MIAIRRLLSGLALAGVLVLGLALSGLIPAREPDLPETEVFDVRKAVMEPSAVVRSDEPPKPSLNAQLSVAWVRLCDAPNAGAYLQKVAVFAADESLLVWCKQGYELFSLRVAARDALQIVHVARFRVRGDLPGGAASGDFDGDGHIDLALGVSATPGVAHRPGAGVFLVRGRAAGGFEPARALVETPAVAVASQRLPEALRSELVVLTRGDVAAQRPGELWFFGQQPVLVREQVAVGALDPRALTLRAGAAPGVLDAWLLGGQPGQVLRVRFDTRQRALLEEPTLNVPVRGAQGFAHDPAFADSVFIRDAANVYRVHESGANATLAMFAEHANVGPFVVRDLDGDQKPDLLAAVEGGLAFFSGGSGEAHERELPSSLQVSDIETAGASSELGVLVLVRGVPDLASLSLLLVPKPPWSPSSEVFLSEHVLQNSPNVAELTLE